MKIYQIVASGLTQLWDTTNKLFSRKVYRSREEAEAAIPEFKQNVITLKDKLDWEALCDDALLKFKIVELELQ